MEVAGGRFLSFWAILGLAGLMLLFTLPDSEAAAMPSLGGGGGDMRSAIKFLQDMDSYYGQIARPRFGKRSDGAVMIPNQSDMYVYGGPSGGQIDMSKARY